MDLTDRLLYLTIGAVLGFFAGFIVAKLTLIEKELEEVIEMQETKPARDESGASRMDKVRSWLLFFVVLVVAFSAIQSQINSNRQQEAQERFEAQVRADTINRCVGGVDTRTVQRDTVEAVYNLYTGTLPSGQAAADLTDIERNRLNRLIDQVNDFREDMYAKIKPSKSCAPFVQDDNVKPPPPPFPRFIDN